MEVYSFLIDFIKTKLSSEHSWNIEYYIGTYASLKLYALKYFKKYGMKQFEEIYNIIFNEWISAFKALKSSDLNSIIKKNEIANHLQNAFDEEKKALELMENLIKY